MNSKALVLGGGGVAGIAWITGVLLGLARNGADFAQADLILGTSAGAAAGAQLASGASLEDLYRRQTRPALQVAEIAPPPRLMEALHAEIAAMATIVDTIARRRRIGRFALEADTVDESVRREVVAGRLPSPNWPERPLSLVAVDAATGEIVEFTRNSGVALVDAVAASCAVPGVWPPVTIGTRRYVDGGVRSPDNLDLAGGFARVLAISPRGEAEGLFGPSPLPEQAARISASGAEVMVVAPDADSRAAMGPNRLDPQVRIAAAEAGLRQGLAESAAARFWQGAKTGAEP